MVGGSHARYADSVDGTAGLIAARFQLLSRSAIGIVEGSFSQFTTGEWATQFNGHGSAMLPLTPHLGLGVLGNGRLNNFEGGVRSGIGTLGPRMGVAVGNTFATVNALIGGVRDVDEVSSEVVTASIQVESLLGQFVLQASVNGARADTIEYADFVAGVRFASPRVALSLSGGVRAGDLENDPWAQLRVQYTPTWNLTLEGAVGRYPQDLIGFTDGLFATIGARVRIVGVASARPGPTPTPLIADRRENGRVRIVIPYSDASQQLAIAGEWNEWTPLPLARNANGEWFVAVDLEPGLYTFGLLVDGVTWAVPDGIASVPDEFGGTVALLLVR